MSVPLFKPTIKRKDMDSVLTCMVSDQISSTSISEELITLVSQYLECQGGAALRDYRRAIDLSLDMLQLKPGDSLILSPLTPLSYFRSMEARGLKPLFCQVDRESATMLPESLEELKKENPQGVILFHPLGLATPMEPFNDWDIPLIEDISQSLGGSWKEKPLGSRGDLVILSMEAQNMITSGGGTLVMTREQYLPVMEDKLLEFSRESFLPDMNASLALVQWGQLDSFIEKRKSLVKLFRSSIQQGKHRLLRQPDGGEAVWYSLPVVLQSPTREVSLYARKKNVETTLAFAGSVLEHLGNQDLCAQARSLSMRTLLFPLYPLMGSKNADMVNKVLLTLP